MNFKFWIAVCRTYCIGVSKDECTGWYFSKAKGAREQKRMGNTVVERSILRNINWGAKVLSSNTGGLWATCELGCYRMC
jgi:hypothetical protein